MQNCRKAGFHPHSNPLPPFGKLRTRGEIGLQPEDSLQSLHAVVTAVGYHEELDLLAEADGYEVSPEGIAQGAGGYASYVEKGVGTAEMTNSNSQPRRRIQFSTR